MNNKINKNEFYDNEIDLRELFGVVWSGKIKIILITFIFAVGSVIYAMSLPNLYKASVILAPANSDGGGLSSVRGQFGGLASLAGVSLGSGKTSESQIAQEIMKSWSFIEKFIIEHSLEVEVYAAKGWIKQLNELEINEDLYDTERSEWLIENSSGNFIPPTSWQLFRKFRQMLSIIEDRKSGLVTVSIEYFSPNIAKKWLDIYVASLNRHMQMRQVRKVSSNIRYLEAQIEKTAIAEMREVFYTIIEEQTKNKMVVEASPEYAFVTVSPSMVPEQKSTPQRALICFLGTLIGGMASVLFVIANYYLRRSNINQTA